MLKANLAVGETGFPVEFKAAVYDTIEGSQVQGYADTTQPVSIAKNSSSFNDLWRDGQSVPLEYP